MKNAGKENETGPRLKTPSHVPESIREPVKSNAPLSIAGLTIIVIFLMAAGKLAVGLLIGSVALLSEGLHTFVDLFAAVISYYTVRTATKPADYDHRYGHGKIENLAGIVQAAFIFIPTAIIIYRAIEGIIHLDRVLSGGGMDIGTGIMALTILVNIYLSVRLSAVAKKYRSEAIRAAAYHQLNDLWTSAGVLIALVLIWIKPEWKILDPLVALVVTMISVWMAWQLFKTSLRTLADRAADEDVDKKIAAIIASKRPLVRGYHNLRTRLSGSQVYTDLHVELCGNLSFGEAHAIIEDTERAIAESVSGADVIIHGDPCVEPCDQCEINKAQRAGESV